MKSTFRKREVFLLKMICFIYYLRAHFIYYLHAYFIHILYYEYE